ncbi:ATP-dependent nuclease [Acinetobacter sp. SM1B]|uniref:ATP-dependent nuclease n=1 Tax=Acinetobacter sp. SM1B TaxID=1497337 RepID=UPI001BC88523|nr:AAA family ATPase [Acinetobacter sp. SM1B]
MTEKLYYWAENLEDYTSDNDTDTENKEVIEIKRLNFFIGKNNAGKSRFLRELFLSKYKINDYNDVNNKNDFYAEIYPIVNSTNGTLIGNNSHFGGSNKADLLNKLKQLDSLPKQFDPKSLYNLKEEISKFRFTKNDATVRISDTIDKYLQSYSKLYIPILRGMRPVTEEVNRQPYIERAQKDYFPDKEKFNSQNIITGECLYHELKIHLLGEPEQRELIKNYEDKLSQYFFDNEPVSLIPKHDQDVVNIKIGKDAQRPLFELGDGLQQAIILTYEAYIKSKDKNGNTETHAFFIEEPELHMHAGMVRQLMNFYLNETPHYYFFTTHSNHLLDMADESDQVMIQKFVKQPKDDDQSKFDFKIYRCDRDRDLLASLGVRPSSVYLANCTIWVEGITDRLYITKYMEKYLAELEKSNKELYKKYRRFMPNYHYTFVEYAGSNLVHWCFSDDYADQLEDKGLSAKAVASEMLLIADGDIQGKADRVQILRKELKTDNYLILECKETENTLPKNSIVRVAIQRFNRMKFKTKDSYDISLINNITDENYFDHKEVGIGKLLDIKLKKGEFKHEVRQFEKSYDNQQAEQISLMV